MTISTDQLQLVDNTLTISTCMVAVTNLDLASHTNLCKVTRRTNLLRSYSSIIIIAVASLYK